MEPWIAPDIDDLAAGARPDRGAASRLLPKPSGDHEPIVALDAPPPGESARNQPKPKVVKLDPSAVDYMPLLGGPPETVTMRSGAVVLLPGQAVGKHTTGEYEEAIVVLAGTGELRVSDGSSHELDRQSVAYCPPATEHDVVNIGVEPLRYIYIVARAR